MEIPVSDFVAIYSRDEQIDVEISTRIAYLLNRFSKSRSTEGGRIEKRSNFKTEFSSLARSTTKRYNFELVFPTSPPIPPRLIFKRN